MKTKSKFFKGLALVLILATIVHPVAYTSTAETVGVTTQVNSEELTPDLTLPSLTQLNRLRLGSLFRMYTTTTWKNIINDRPNIAEFLCVQLFSLDYNSELSILVVNRSDFSIIKEITLTPGEGFNIYIAKDTQWDMYVKGNSTNSYAYAFFKVTY